MKNRKKQSKGSGAASRHDKKFEDAIRQRDEREAAEQGGSQANDGSDEAVARAAKRRARKELEAATTRDLNWVSTLLNRLASLFMLALLLSQQDFATAFGRGTGQNTAHISPLGIVVWHAANNEYVQSNVKVRRAATQALTMLAVPGEAYKEYIRKPTAAEKKAAKKAARKKKKGNAEGGEEPEKRPSGWAVWRKSADKWVKKVSKDKSMTQVLEGNLFIGGGALVCLVFGLVSPAVPAANVITAAGIAGMFVGLNSATQVAGKPTDLSFYALVVLVAASAIGSLFETDQKKLAKLKKKQARKKARQFVDAPSADEMADAMR